MSYVTQKIKNIICIEKILNKYIKTGEIEERESYFLFGYDGDIIEIDNLVNIKENK